MLISNLIAVAATLAAEVVGNIFDVSMTRKGITAGVAVEASSWFGQKPSAFQLYLEDAVYAIPALATYLVIGFTDTYATYPFLVVPLLYALKHLQGGLKWRYLLAGGTLDPEGFPLVDGNQQAHSAWQKFIGPWLWNLPKK